MSSYKKGSAPAPAPEESLEPIREVPTNTPVARGMAAAGKQELDNRKGELAQAIQDLARIKKGRGNLQAMRDSYERCYSRIERLANMVASMTGKGVEIPVYDPPAEAVNPKTRTVEPPGFDRGTYRETKGLGKSGAGLPTAAPVPGTGQGNEKGEWL